MSPQAPYLAPERDAAFKFGRPKPSGGTQPYNIPGAVRGTDSTFGLAAGSDWYCPFFVDTPILVDQLACEVTTLSAANNTRMGLYPADTDYQPVGAPLLDSGDISTASTGVKTYTPGSPVLLPRGRWVTIHAQSGAAVFRAYTSNLALKQLNPSLGTNAELNTLNNTRAYAAFPTPGTAWNTASYSSIGMLYTVFLRISTP